MITPARVAQLIVHHPDGRRRGSGYLITSTAILTAAHVIEDAVSVEVRFLSGTTTALSWEIGESDIAVVTIAAESDVEPAKFGYVGDHPAILEVQAVGFPRWKMRNDDGTTFVDGDARPAQRLSYHLRGTAAVLSNMREDTLEVEIQSAPGIVDAWEGMSGAALWVDDRIIGVISAHHPSEGPTRLTAVRAQGVSPIPDTSPDVTTSVHRLIRAYQAQLADIAPAKLHDRADEMAVLTRFCVGDAPYAWWQAGPWAGKTALLSSFALSPPTGVDVVSFFITSRFAGQSDSTAFTDALLEQLGALAGEPVRDLLQSRSPHGEMLRLLKEVSVERHLVLVVDGLDEDTSAATGLPSIAALLPARAIPGLRILIASRPHPDLPDDVPADHLLRSTEIRQLPVYSDAKTTETTARDELMRSLKGSPLQQLVLGLITAAGGGLTVNDLAELTGEPPYKMRPLFGGMFGRSLSARRSLHTPDEQTYLFAHETLRVTAEREFGAELATYRATLHEWADRYQQAGWPTSTPAYMIRGYSRLLAQLQDQPRMLVLALDQARHDWLLDHTGGDALAFAEIAAVVRLLAEQPQPDFVVLVRLALVRDLLLERNANIPAALPATWVKLGRPERGIAMVDALSVGAARTNALNRLIGALVVNGQLDEAIGLAAEITAPRDRSRALDSVVSALVYGANKYRAINVARDIPDSAMRDWALSRVVASFAGSPERALELVDEIRSPRVRARGLEALATQFYAAGHARPDLLAKAEKLISGLDPGHDRDLATAELARALAMTGELSWAEETIKGISNKSIRIGSQAELAGIVKIAAGVVDDVSTLDREVRASSRQDLGLQAQVLARQGLLDDAENTVRRIEDPHKLVGAMSELAALMPVERGVALAIEAEIAARGIVSPDSRMQRLGDLVDALITMRDLHTADEVGRRLDRRGRRGRPEHPALAKLADAWVLNDELTVARGITDPIDKVDALCMLVNRRAIDNGMVIAEAEEVARSITSPDLRLKGLCEVARACAKTWRLEKAKRIVAEVSDRLDTESHPSVAQRIYSVRLALSRDTERNGIGDMIRTIRSLSIGNVAQVLETGDGQAAAAVVTEHVAEYRRTGNAWTIRYFVEQVLYADKSPENEAIALVALTPLLVDLLGTSKWSSVLAGVARLAPEAVQVVLEALHGQYPD
jgi:hypothetical protein